MDVLSDLLERSRARGAAFSQSTLHGPWGVRFPGEAGLAVHVIVDGELHAWADDANRSQRLQGGDVILVRGDLVHHLGYRPGAPCQSWMEVLGDGARQRVVGTPDGRPPAVFACGAYLFEGDLCAPLLRAMPDLVRLRPAAGSTLRVTVDLMVAEMRGSAPGQQALLDRLLDAALVQALRDHFARDEADAPGWFRATRDPALDAALQALHDDPARPWTVAELAACGHLSRATFARRFTETVGVPPLGYLTDWRMAIARQRLRDSEDGLAAVAVAVGYTSPFAFAAAFKRHFGVAPGRWRAAP